jgi:hypothetical protein
MIKKIKNRLGQEEMVGFALIVIIVAVILLVFLSLSFSKRNTQTVQSYEVENFLKTSLQYTTNCEFYREGYVSLETLIFKCYENKTCINGNNGCVVLGTTLKEMLNESWKAGSDKPIQGYVLNISINGQQLKSFKEGNTTLNSRGDTELRNKGSASLEISLDVYG